MTGTASTTVFHAPSSQPSEGEQPSELPANTMFHRLPCQPPQLLLRESHCCCEPEFTEPVKLEFAMNPPLDAPVCQRLAPPETSMPRR